MKINVDRLYKHMSFLLSGLDFIHVQEALKVYISPGFSLPLHVMYQIIFFLGSAEYQVHCLRFGQIQNQILNPGTFIRT